MARNRVIYQSEALFVGDGTILPTGTHPAGNIKQLHRVQSANYGFTVNRQDVNQFGNLARIDNIIVEAPTVNLDFSYYLATGQNEASLGFYTAGTNSGDAQQFVQNHIGTGIRAISGVNFHILTTSEGSDANGNAGYTGASSNTIGLGNAFISNYSVEAAVGGLPTVSVTCEATNINTITGSSGVVPGVVLSDGTASTLLFALPAPVSGDLTLSALRPGDVKINISDSTEIALASSLNVQSASIEVPLGRSTLQRLGSKFGYAKAVDFPIEVTMNVSAILTDQEASGGSLASLVSSDTSKKASLVFKSPTASDYMVFEIRNAKLNSESFSTSIGDNKTVDLTLTTQIGGPTDTTNGIFFWKQGSAYTG